jgi:hypothetical protein
VILQNGTGPFSAIWVYNNSTDVIHQGDRVRVRGTVEYNFGVNRINVSTSSDVQILSTNNTLPAPQILTTLEMGNHKLGGDTTIKKWESVFVKLNVPVYINCINAQTGVSCLYQDPPLPDSSFRRNYGEIWVTDNSNYPARIELQDGHHTYTNNWDGVTIGKKLLTKNDSITFIQGILYFSFSNYKLVPRDTLDFGIWKTVGISHNENEVVTKYSLLQNYPNPFNPVTNIKFQIPENAYVTLKIYDVLGKEIKTLVNQQMNTGSYNVTFDGTNMSSGVYFYRISTVGKNGIKFVDTKRMVLIK